MTAAAGILISGGRAEIMTMALGADGKPRREERFCVPSAELFNAAPQDARLKKILARNPLCIAAGFELFYHAKAAFSHNDRAAAIASARYKAAAQVPEEARTLKAACFEPLAGKGGTGLETSVFFAPEADFHDIPAAQRLDFAPWIAAALDGLAFEQDAKDDFTLIAARGQETCALAVGGGRLSGLVRVYCAPDENAKRRIDGLCRENGGAVFGAADAQRDFIPDNCRDAGALTELILSGLCLRGLGRARIKFEWCQDTLPLLRHAKRQLKTTAALVCAGSFLLLAAAGLNMRWAARMEKETALRTHKLFELVCGRDAPMPDPERQIAIALENTSGSDGRADCGLYAGAIRAVDRAAETCGNINPLAISLNGRSLDLRARTDTMQRAEDFRALLGRDTQDSRIGRIETTDDGAEFSLSAKI